MSTNRKRGGRLAGLTRAGTAVVAAGVVAFAAGCSGGGSSSDGGAVPTLLTVAVDATSTSSSSPSVDPTTTAADSVAPAATTAVEATVAPGASTLPATTIATTGGSGPVQPGSTAPGSAPGASTSTAQVTTTTLDIEPAPPPIAPTSPVPTASAPPDVLGGTEADFLVAPTALAGVRFGASQATLLTRLNQLLGQPLYAEQLADCPAGPAWAFQWYGLGAVVSDQGFAYFSLALDADSYEGLPVPGWHTATGLTVGWTLQQLQAAAPGQVTVDATSGGGYAEFEVTGGVDAGLAGVAANDVIQSVSAGTTDC